MEELCDKLDILYNNVTRIDDGFKDIQARLKALEEDKVQKSHGRRDITEPKAPVNENQQNPVIPPTENEPQGAVGGSVQDYTHVQQEFNVIKDSLQRVRLPNELKVNDSSVGIQRADQPRLKVVSRSHQIW